MNALEGKQKLRDFLHRHVPCVDQEMYAFLPEQEPYPFLYRPMRDYPSRGGKRFRAALVLLCCDALGGNIEHAMRTAAAFEILQSFLLIHDDIEDDSEMRRGKPCLHKIYGVPLSVNVGDTLYAKVFEALLANRPILGLERTMRLVGEMVRGCQITCEGQAYDIGWIRERVIPREDEFMTMLRKKTGWYSGRGPCAAGAIVAGVDGKKEGAIGNFGETMAIAFQIRDDLLNLTVGEEDAERAPGATAGSYGKERGGDIAEGKRTLIIIDLFHKCTDQERKEVKEILDKDRSLNTPDEIEGIISLLEKYGCLEYAQSVCEQKARESEASLSILPESESKEILKEMLDFLISRDF